MPDAEPDAPLSARGFRPFILGGVAGCPMGLFSCFIVVNARHWYLLAAWIALTILWSGYFPTWRTRMGFVVGSVTGLLVTLGGLLLLVKMISPFPDNWSGPG